MARRHIVHGVFYYQEDKGLFFIVPESVMPFHKQPKKELSEKEALFYHQAGYYDSMVELRIDADQTILAMIASAGLATGNPIRWISAVIEIFLSGPQPYSLSVIVRRFVTHESIAAKAYARSSENGAASALENWLGSEAELLHD